MNIYDSLLAKAINGGGGSGGGGAMIITDNGTALDKTYAEIYDLIESGTPCYISYTGAKSTQDLDSDYTYSVNLFPVVSVYKYADAYRIMAVSMAEGDVSSTGYTGIPSIWTYEASVSSDYPTFLKRTYVKSTCLWAVDDRTV